MTYPLDSVSCHSLNEYQCLVLVVSRHQTVRCQMTTSGVVSMSRPAAGGNREKDFGFSIVSYRTLSEALHHNLHVSSENNLQRILIWRGYATVDFKQSIPKQGIDFRDQVLLSLRRGLPNYKIRRQKRLLQNLLSTTTPVNLWTPDTRGLFLLLFHNESPVYCVSLLVTLNG